MSTGSIRLISDNAYMATHVIEEDSKTKHLERIVSSVGLAEMSSTPGYSTSVTGTSSTFSCVGKGNVLIKCLNTLEDGNVAIRCLMYDGSSNLISVTGIRESSTVSGVMESSKYLMETFVLSNMQIGASSFKIQVTSISGSVDFYPSAF